MTVQSDPMERGLLGSTDLTVSAICHGGGAFGSACKGDELVARIDHYRRAGGNFLDTAHCYAFWHSQGAGCSERAIGEYVRRNGRGDLVIATKGGHPAAPGYERPQRYLAAERIAADLDESLRNLALDTIDLYWLHRDDTRVPVAEIVELLNAEVRRGRIRHFGASNWHPTRLRQAREYATAYGLQGFAANQPEWNLARKNGLPADDPGPGTGAEMRVLTPAAREWQRTVAIPAVPYSAAACGYFASGGNRARQAYENPVTRARLERAQALAGRRGRTPGQIALAWLMNQDIQVVPIIGTLNAEHLADHLAAADIPLTPAEVAWLEHGEDRSS